MIAPLAAGLIAALAAGDTEAARTVNTAIEALLGAPSAKGAGRRVRIPVGDVAATGIVAHGRATAGQADDQG